MDIFNDTMKTITKETIFSMLSKLLIVSAMIASIFFSRYVDYRIDGSSEESLLESLGRMVINQSEDKRNKTIRNFNYIENTYVGHIAFRVQGEASKDRHYRFRNAVHGMNAEQIAQEAVRVKQAWDLADLLSLRRSVNDYQQAEALLKKVAISDITLSPSENRQDCILEATIHNTSELPFYGVKFHAEYLLNGKSQKSGLYFKFSEPLLENYSILAKTDFPYCEGTTHHSKSYNVDPVFTDLPVTILYKENGKELVRVDSPSLNMQKSLEELEAKYFARYGKDEPEFWKNNILRSMATQNLYIRQ